MMELEKADKDREKEKKAIKLLNNIV